MAITSDPQPIVITGKVYLLMRGPGIGTGGWRLVPVPRSPP